MQDEKLKIIKEIKELWNNQDIKEFEISLKLLDYLSIKDLENLKIKILDSYKKLNNEEKEWLKKFKKF